MSEAIQRFERENALVLPSSFAGALILLLAVLGYLAAYELVSAKPMVSNPGLTPIEAQIYEKPPEQSHLVEAKKPIAVKAHAARPEPVLSKTVGVGKEAPKGTAQPLTEINQTQAPQPGIVSHGPVVLSSPAPKLPEYLKNQNLKTTVLIEFVISEGGQASPHLLGSSGNEELDALALKTAQTWTFSPAMQSNHAVASKVRLRINFEVE